MNLLLQRHEYTDQSTVGDLLIDGEEFSYTLELPKKDGLPGSAIPAGTYPIVLAPSPKFEKSSDPWVLRYSSAMPHIMDIPGRSLIMIHWGDVPQNTDGCVLVGFLHPAPDLIEESRMAFERLYANIQQALSQGEPLAITVQG